MSFVPSSDNKYVQWRYVGTATTGTPNPFLDTANWQKQGAEVTVSQNTQTEHDEITIGSNIHTIPSIKDLQKLWLEDGKIFEPSEYAGYMLSDGSLYSAPQFHCKYIEFPVKQGEKYKYKGWGAASAYSCVVYDISNNIISSIQYDAQIDYAEITIPSGGVKAKFSSFANASDDIIFELIKSDSIYGEFVLLNTNLSTLNNTVNVEINKLNMDVNVNTMFTEQLGYLISDGTYYNDPTKHCKSLRVQCKEGDKFYYRGNAILSAQSYVIFNGSIVIDYGQIGSKTEWGSCTIPQNATSVIFSSFESVGDDIVFEVMSGDNLRVLIANVNDIINTELFSPKKISYAGYMLSDGTLYSAPQFHCEYIDYNCNVGDVFFYRGYGSWSAYCWVIFDASNNVLSSQQVDSINDFNKIVIPDGGKRIRLSSFANAEDSINWEAVSDKTIFGKTEYTYNHDEQESFDTEDVLYGKKWLAVGDSFTHGDYSHDTTGTYLFESGKYEGLNKVYPRFIALRNNMNLVIDAINGSTMAVATSYVDNPQNDPHNPYAYQRYLNIPQDVDYITIWFGINDSNNCTLGTINDNTIGTFYGAWNIVMEWILTNRPNAKVGIVVSNLTLGTFRQATRDIALKWGIPYLDMMSDPQVPDIFGKDTQGYSQVAQDLRIAHWRVSAENAHPNQFCHEYESTFIENWLRTL